MLNALLTHEVNRNPGNAAKQNELERSFNSPNVKFIPRISHTRQSSPLRPSIWAEYRYRIGIPKAEKRYYPGQPLVPSCKQTVLPHRLSLYINSEIKPGLFDYDLKARWSPRLHNEGQG